MIGSARAVRRMLRTIRPRRRLVLTASRSRRLTLKASDSEGVGNLVGVPWEGPLVGVLVVVRLGRAVDEDGVGRADVLHGVPDAGRDHQVGAIVLAEVQLVQHSACRRALAVVVQHDLGSAEGEEEAVTVGPVKYPALDLLRPDRDLVDVDERLVAQSPGWVVDLAD